jgi:hypothetical protein
VHSDEAMLKAKYDVTAFPTLLVTFTDATDDATGVSHVCQHQR